MTAIGPVAAGAHMVHRARGARDLAPACGHVTHGRETAIVEVVAEAVSTGLRDAQKALTAAGEQPCRLCRRCWRANQFTQHEGHERACWRKTS